MHILLSVSEDLCVVGLNHATAPVAVREAVSPRPYESGRLCGAVRAALGLRDAVVLATCSRFEVYASVSAAELPGALDWFSARAGRDIRDMLYVRRGSEAVLHLFRVAAGLDSWVLGETEILGQVKAAYQAACAERTAGRAAHLAFQRALYIGKKVRNETGIVGGINSIGGAACVLAKCIFSDLKDKRILVFGAGTMAAATVRHLCAKGITGVWVANRSLEKAQALAADLGGVAMPLAEGLSRLGEADVAVFSTASDRFLLDAARARELARERGGRSLFLVDLALPRNVDPEAAKVDGICLYDIDDLSRLVRESLARRECDLSGAEALVREEGAECWARLQSAGVPRAAAR